MSYCYINAFGDEVCEDSGWHRWGRWVLLGIIIAAMLLFIAGFIAFSYISSRRRTRQGIKPMYGTAWAAPPAYAAKDPHPEAGAKMETLPSYAPPPRQENGVAV